jgi:hypothetical protein
MNPKSHLSIIVLPSLAGAVFCATIFAPLFRGPGDPGGNFVGAGLGGFFGLLVGLIARTFVYAPPEQPPLTKDE